MPMIRRRALSYTVNVMANRIKMTAPRNFRGFAPAIFAALFLAGCGQAALYTPEPVLSWIPGGAEGRARQMVDDALAFARANGHETAFRRINEGDFARGQFYVFVVDAVHNRTLANPANPQIVGTAADEVAVDGVDRRASQQALIDGATAAGAWVRYRWIHPQTGAPQNKKTWAVRVGDYIYGCGFYEEE